MLSSEDDDEENGLPRFGRKRRKGDDAMLGIFGDDSDDDSDDKRSGGRRGRQSGDKDKPLSARPVGFVSSSKAPQLNPEGSEGAPRNAPQPPPRPAASNAAASSFVVPPVENADKDFGAFEAHNGGIGSKILAKMGWSKGMAIGKNQQGIVNPLEQKLRPTSMGLGYGGFRETTAKAKLQQERILHAESQRPEASDDSDEELAKERRRAQKQQQQQQQQTGAAAQEPKRQHWKKQERRALNVKSAAELRESWAKAAAEKAGAPADGSGAAGAPEAMTVVDMRGPHARVHSSLTSALASAPDELAPTAAEAAGGLLPELKHNVRMCVDLAEIEIDRKHRAQRTEREALASLSERRDAQAATARQAAARLHEVSALREAVEGVARASRESVAQLRAALTARVGAADGGGSASASSSLLPEASLAPLIEAADSWRAVREAHPEGFAAWRLADVAVSMVADAMRLTFRAWRPLQAPSYGTELMARWQQALGGGGAGGLPGGGPAGDTAGGAAGGAYEALVYVAIMPALRGALANEWKARSSDEAIQLLSGWRQLLPDALWRPLFSAQILPRLASELSSWQPRADTTPPHHWLHPWLPLLPPPGLSDLFPQLRHKLAALIAHAPLVGGTLLGAIAPWRRVLDDASWRALLHRHLLPRLAKALSTDVAIPRSGGALPIDTLGLLDAVAAWGDVALSAEQLALLIGQRLVARLVGVLNEWLADGADYAEVEAWYGAWRAALAERVPAAVAHAEVRAHFYAALRVINAALVTAGEVEDSDDEPMQAAPTRAVPSMAAETPRPPAAGPDETTASASAAPPAEDGLGDELSLRESLEHLAASHDLVFMPTSARQQGKLVFSFGDVPVYIDPDKKIMCARLSRAAGFKPTSLTELVEAATASKS